MSPEIDQDWTEAFREMYPDDNPTPMITARAIERLLKESDNQAEVISRMCLVNNNLKSTVFDRASKHTPLIARIVEQGAQLARTDTYRQLDADAMLMTSDAPVTGIHACFRIHSVRTLLYWADRDKSSAHQIESAIGSLLSSLHLQPEDFQKRDVSENSKIIRQAMDITPSFPEINIHQQALITVQRVSEETQGSLDAIASQTSGYSTTDATAEDHARLAATHLTARTLISCITP